MTIVVGPLKGQPTRRRATSTIAAQDSLDVQGNALRERVNIRDTTRLPSFTHSTNSSPEAAVFSKISLVAMTSPPSRNCTRGAMMVATELGHAMEEYL